jgi:hypothetical protein
MINIAKALNTLYPQVAYSRGATIDTIQGFDADNNIVSFDKDAVLAQAQKDDCKTQAKALLAASDWAVLPDVGLKNAADFVYYRGILRGLVTQPQVTPDFPVEPTPVWE